jgi:hypothetical protein
MLERFQERLALVDLDVLVSIGALRLLLQVQAGSLVSFKIHLYVSRSVLLLGVPWREVLKDKVDLRLEGLVFTEVLDEIGGHVLIVED